MSTKILLTDGSGVVKGSVFYDSAADEIRIASHDSNSPSHIDGYIAVSSAGLSVGGSALTVRESFGADITDDVATGTLAHNTRYSLDGTTNAIDVTVNAGTQGDVMKFIVSNVSNAVGFVAGTATLVTYGSTTITGLAVNDRVTLEWVTASVVHITTESVAV